MSKNEVLAFDEKLGKFVTKDGSVAFPDNEQRSSNTRLDGRTHWEDCWRDHLDCAVAKVERLTRELSGTKDELYSVDKAAKELGAERDRLTAELASFKKDWDRMARQVETHIAYSNERASSEARLRAALQWMLDGKGTRSAAQCLDKAREALAGAADETSAVRCPSCERYLDPEKYSSDTACKHYWGQVRNACSIADIRECIHCHVLTVIRPAENGHDERQP